MIRYYRIFVTNAFYHSSYYTILPYTKEKDISIIRRRQQTPTFHGSSFCRRFSSSIRIRDCVSAVNSPSERRVIHSVQAFEKNSLFSAVFDKLATNKHLHLVYYSINRYIFVNFFILQEYMLHTTIFRAHVECTTKSIQLWFDPVLQTSNRFNQMIALCAQTHLRRCLGSPQRHTITRRQQLHQPLLIFGRQPLQRLAINNILQIRVDQERVGRFKIDTALACLLDLRSVAQFGIASPAKLRLLITRSQQYTQCVKTRQRIHVILRLITINTIFMQTDCNYYSESITRNVQCYLRAIMITDVRR